MEALTSTPGQYVPEKTKEKKQKEISVSTRTVRVSFVVECMDLVFTRCTSGGIYLRCAYLLACQVRVTVGDSSLYFLYDIFRALINFLVCWGHSQSDEH